MHLGRLMGPVGFARTVAIKRLHPQFAKDPEFVSMFLDEARLAARVVHPNVVSILDVVALEGELFLVMDYVQGESLSRLLRAANKLGERMPPRIALGIMTGVLYGLQAAHEATTERGEPLCLVHRDVSPQNILIGVDGVARLLDFGVAKAAGQSHSTREGTLKGKVPYMAPEQINYGMVDRRIDVYSAAVVLWEMLTGARLFDGPTEAAMLAAVMAGRVYPPSAVVPSVPRSVDDAVLRGLFQNPADRYATAKEMAIALERAMTPAIPRQVGEWVDAHANEVLRKRAEQVKEVESISVVSAGHLPAGYAPSQVAPVAREDASWTTGRSQVASLPPSRQQREPGPGAGANFRLILLALVGMGSVFLVVAIALMVLIVRSRPVAPAPAAQPTSEPIVAPLPVVTASAPVASASVAPAASEVPSAPPPATAAATVTATATATAEATGTAPATATAKTGPAKTSPATTATSRPPSGNCNPPYTIDAKGFHVPKPECL